MKCKECGKDFSPTDRAGIDANTANIERIKYCSVECQRTSANRRYYNRHKDQVIARVIANKNSP